MASKIILQISKLKEEELLESMDNLVMQLEQRFGGNETDELLYQLAAERVIYSEKNVNHYSSKARNDQFCLDLEQVIELVELQPILEAILASIEVQLGSAVAEEIMYHIIYRLGVRNGKYDKETGEKDDDDDDDDDDDNKNEDNEECSKVSSILCFNAKNEQHENQPPNYITNLRNNHKDVNVQSMKSNEEINRANEEYEQQATETKLKKINNTN